MAEMTPLKVLPASRSSDIELTCGEALFQSECWRQTIMLDVSQAFSKWTSPDSQFSPDPDTADTLCLRLQKWWDERSPSLDPHKNPLPENLLTA
jgi:hypothetical protein